MRYAFTLICMCVTLSMSAQQWYFWLDEYHPAERPLLEQDYAVLLVNNSKEQPADFGHSLAEDGRTIGNDSVGLPQAALHCLFTATQSLNDYHLYPRVELLEKSQNHSANYYTRSLMTSSQMEALCADYEVDALVILNQLVLYDIVESYLTNNNTYFAYLRACAQSHWTVYDAASRSTSTFSHADTLFWESNEMYRRTTVLSQLPSREDALMYLAREVGSNVAQSLAPQWVPAKRYLYEYADADLRAGLDAFRQQRWQEALQLWQAAIDGKDKKAAAAAAANSAIAYELLDDYASAYVYGEKALHLFGDWKNAYGRQQQVNIRYYLEHLRTRQATVGDR